jgi:hypothetical protein
MKEAYTEKGLTLKIQEKEKEIIVFWEGRSTERDPSVFIMPVINEMLDTHKKIVFNFKNLSFMNSSTVTPILKIMDQFQSTNDEILIVYDKNVKWQELSFSALEIFKTEDGRIEIVGE